MNFKKDKIDKNNTVKINGKNVKIFNEEELKKTKRTKKILIGIGIVAILIFVPPFLFSSTNDDSKQTSQDTSIGAVSKSNNQNKYDNVDFKKASEELKNDILSSESYNYVRDLSVQANLDKKELLFTTAVGDAINEETALELADTLIRRFQLFLTMNNNIKLKGPQKDYYGELYDDFDIKIGVAPLSHTTEMDKWLLHDVIFKGTHSKLKNRL